MSYTALYRKFRPAEFADVKGQDHIITTLQNQIKANRIGHAYLFCGTRGTGKTTVAKIFAKAVNCEHPVDGSPCGECEMCRSIAAGTSMNVIEIDAASNNGVDNIREIREEVAYRPTEGRYKVYIIDEVHMLSIGAFNALLKTLEEPPEYVIFILATTEVHKIPITILSRCQHYDFKRISIETITDRMKELMDTEKVDVEDKALRYIAKAADGSMRDALSLLDQCIAFYMGQKLTYDNVLEVLGAVDTDVFSRLLRKVIDRDVAGVLDIVAGNSEGRLLFFKNNGTDAEPDFAMSEEICAGGKPILLRPGYHVVQGPFEASWGYLCPTVYDWNGDGLLDVMVSGSRKKYEIMLNEGTPTEPRLAAPVPIMVDNLELYGTWRVRPAITKVGGVNVMAIMDEDNALHLYRQVDDYNV